MPNIAYIHASGRWSLVQQHLAADVAGWRKLASIISHTEIAGLSQAQVEAIMGGPEWDNWRGPNLPGQDECAVQWDARAWSLVSGRAVKLTDTQYWADVAPGEPGRKIAKFHAAVVALKHLETGEIVTVVAVHMPVRNTSLRRQVWTECAIALRDMVKATEGHVILAADWNAGWRKPVDQLLLKSALAGSGLTFAWDGRVPANADDNLIDGIATNLPVVSTAVLPNPASAEHFHQPALATLSLPAAVPPTPAPVPTPEPAPEAPVSKLPSNLPQILKDAGLKVAVHPGWEGRGRSGAFAPVGVLCHHTATRKSSSDTGVIRLLVDGRSDLPGPLCQLGLARDGTVHIIAAGRANHAGKAKASGSVAGSDDGNRLYIGIEAFNDGVGEPWPKAQYDAYVLLAATLSREITGNSAQTVRAHKETSKTGKVDPLFPMDPFRASVAKRIDDKPASPTKEAPVLNNVQKARVDIAEAIAEINRAAALLNLVDKKRVAARAQIAALVAVRVTLAAILKRLPAA